MSQPSLSVDDSHTVQDDAPEGEPGTDLDKIEDDDAETEEVGKIGI